MNIEQVIDLSNSDRVISLGENTIMFLHKAQFIVLTCIATLLLVISLELAGMKATSAFGGIQKVAICDLEKTDVCTTVFNSQYGSNTLVVTK